jgi:hypothetical protein
MMREEFPCRYHLAFTILVSCVLVSGCGKNRQVALEAPPAVYQPSPTTETSIRVTDVVAPKLGEVRDAVTRIFKDSVTIDTSHNPNFFAGDFNGDSSQDIAVILKPVPEHLNKLNEEYPPWLIRDPLAGKETSSLHISENEVFLAVIHGFGTNDWRDPQATQTFVLKNVVGNQIEVSTGQQFLAANSGRKLPRPRGDLIAEVLRGSAGYLYYATSTYAWYDPKTYRPDTERTVVHMRRPVSK